MHIIFSFIRKYFNIHQSFVDVKLTLVYVKDIHIFVLLAQKKREKEKRRKEKIDKEKDT
jgi:hypothetical protein